jgi:hypothetical protein
MCDLYAEPAIVNGASRYSYACSAVKYSPNRTVKNSPWVLVVHEVLMLQLLLMLVGLLYLVEGLVRG